MSGELQKQLAKLEKAIYKLVGNEFNINSTQQLADVLFGKLGLRPADRGRKTAAGKYSTAADVLEDMRGQHEVIELILEQRELSKLKSTYVDALPLAVNPATGRVHTNYKQTGSVTGRIASEAAQPAEHPHPHRAGPARCARPLWPRAAAGWWPPTTRRSSCAWPPTSHRTPPCSKPSARAKTSTPPPPPPCWGWPRTR